MRLAKFSLWLGLLFIAFVAGATIAQAQTTPLGIGTAEPSFSSSFAPLEHLLIIINQYQQRFYHALTAALKAMRDDPFKVLILIGLSFAYGVFHAAGPGHGKAVISSYLIANEKQLKRGIGVAILASLAQAVSAILLVGTAYFVLRGTSVSMRDATLYMEKASFLLVAAFGAWLLFSKTRAIFAGRARAIPLTETAAPAMPAMAVSSASGRQEPGAMRFQAEEITPHPDPNHIHGPDCGCGHIHMPMPADLAGNRMDWKAAGSAILAIGMRPCSGALIVLTFAILNGLVLGGIASVFAMAIGTAITVSVLAIIAVSFKGLAVRLAGGGSGRGAFVGHAIEILGALFVLMIGLTLFAASVAAS
ncbi:nickel/cobalt transporter [Martelella alba]|uniref:Nickel/cobalt efflux system n=1 Tax=Martelella alba TaxID=2590451 RepID=A0A506UFE6_9HYPH|nr:nickel/cobalt transporter [Martelella alba]TPW32498.1 nickel/cobalt transporter [Martelella alba]